MLLPALLRPAAALLALLPAWGAAASIGLFTIVDGEVALLRETQRFDATEGVRLQADDIVRTGAQTRLVRIELADGTVLDLGPDTELLLPRSVAALEERGAGVYLARGWLKVGAGSSGAGIASAALDLRRVSGTAVLHLSAEAQTGFIEVGGAELSERGPARTQALKEGDAFARRGTAPASLQKRMPAELLQGLPRPFVDSIPRRAARFQAAPVELRNGSDTAYAEVAHWLNGETVLRPHFLARFASLARQRDFRAGLIADLRVHPEWDRVLFPEKYRPKPVVVVARRPAPAPVPATPLDTVPTLPVAVNVNLQGLMTWPGMSREFTSASTLEKR